MSHTAIGLEVINKLGEACTDIGIIEKPAALDGRQMIMFLAPKSTTPAKTKKEKADKDSEKTKRASENAKASRTIVFL